MQWLNIWHCYQSIGYVVNTLRTLRAIKIKACCILASTELDVPKEQAQGPTIFLSLNSNKKKNHCYQTTFIFCFLTKNSNSALQM